MHVRRCRACAEEYRPEVVTCVECGGPLEDADDEAVPFEARPVPGPPPRAVPPERKPPEGYVPVYVGHSLADVEPLVLGLEEAGIPSHVQETPERPGRAAAVYSLLVPEAEAPGARRALGPLLGEGADPEAADRGFDAEAGYSHCPACSAEIPGGAETCPDCGLTVSPEVEEEG